MATPMIGPQPDPFAYSGPTSAGDAISQGYSAEDVATLFPGGDVPVSDGAGTALTPDYTDVTPTDQTAAGDSSHALSGVADVFGAIATSFGKAYSTLNPPRPQTLPGQTGSYVYNSATGKYVPAVQGSTGMNTTSVVLILAVILGVAYIATHHK